jgi:hypothetical protein
MFDNDDTDTADEADPGAEADETEADEATTTDDEAADSARNGPEGEGALDDSGDDTDASQDGDQAEKPGKYRERLALAEQERDDAVAQLVAQRRAIMDRALHDAGLPAAVAKAAGLDVGKFLTADGLVDTAALANVANQIREENRLPRRPQPIGIAGQGQSGKGESFGSVLREVATGSH